MIAIDDATTGRLIASIAMQIPIESSVTSFHRWLVWNRDGSLLAAIDQQRVVHIWRESGVQPPDAPITNIPRPITVQATWTPIPLPQVSSPRLPSKIIRKLPSNTPLPWDTRPKITLPYIQPNGVLAVGFDPTHKQWVLYDRSHPIQFLYVFRNVALGVGSRFTPDVSWSPTGRYLAYIQDVANVDILDLQTYQIVEVIHHNSQVIRMIWHPTQPWLASESFDSPLFEAGQLIVYDVQAQRTLYTGQLFGEANDYAWMGNAPQLLIWGADAGMRTLNVITGMATVLYNERDKTPAAFIVGMLSPDGHYLAFINNVGDTFQIHFFDLWLGAVVQTLPFNELMPISWSPDGTQLATSDNTNAVVILGN